MRPPSLDKIAFVLSVAVFAFLYGIATQAFGWFPSPYFERAWDQAKAVMPIQLEDNSNVHWRVDAVYDREGAQIEQPSEVATGYRLVASHWNDTGWEPAVRLLDINGNVVHRWQVEPPQTVDDSTRRIIADVNIHGSSLLPSGDLTINIGGTAVAQLDACSRIRWWRNIEGHHALTRADDGTFWLASWSDTVIDESVTSAFRRNNLGETNTIVHLSQDGKTIDKISVLSLISNSPDLLRRIFSERHYRYNGNAHVRDLTHLNDVEPLSKKDANAYPQFDEGDLLLSFKHLNMITVVDPDTHEVEWHSSFSSPLLRQHDPDYLGNGWIGIYNNAQDGSYRGHRLGGSSIIAIQPSTDSVKTLYPKSDSAMFYSRYGGKWQYLDNGNLLITEMSTGRIFEVTSEGQIVWEWIKEGILMFTDQPTMTEALRSAGDSRIPSGRDRGG